MKRVETISAPQAFAPAGGGFVFLRPSGPSAVSLELTTLDGGQGRHYRRIENPRSDVTSDRAGRLICWSQTEQAESDLAIVRIN